MALSNSSLLKIRLTMRISIHIRSAVQRSPFRLILEQTHSLDILPQIISLVPSKQFITLKRKVVRNLHSSHPS